MQIENLINKSTDTKNTDTKTINDMTAGMRVSDYIKTDSSDNMSKKAAVVGSSNSVDMSDTIYARPQAKNEAGNNDGADMAENLLNDMNQTCLKHSDIVFKQLFSLLIVCDYHSRY